MTSRRIIQQHLRSPSCPFYKSFSSVSKKGDKGGSGTDKKKKGGENNSKQLVEVLQKFIATAEKAKKFKPEFNEEEKADHKRIGANYSLQSTLLHNKTEKDLATKIWLQSEAMNSMRADLRAHADITDEEPPPADRPWPVWNTPPIKGFNPRDYMNKVGDDDNEEGAVDYNL